MFVLVGATLGLALVGYVFLVRRFAAPGTSWAVRLHVGLAWLVSLSILLLVPFDIFSTRDSGNGAGVPVPELATAFSALYYTACLLAYVAGPIHLGLVNSPEFGTRARLRSFLRKNLMLAGIGGAAGAIVLAYVVVYKRVDLHTLLVLLSSAKVLYNSYGLVLGVLLLSYGLVEVPRWAWRQVAVEAGQEMAFRKLRFASDKVWGHYSDLSEAMAVVASLRQIHRRDRAKPLLNTIERDGQGILPESVEVDIGEQDLDYEPDEEGMTALRARVVTAAVGFQRRRARYMEHLSQVRALQRALDRRRDRPGAALLRDAAWRSAAALAALFSLAITVAEATLPVAQPDLSVPSLLVRGLVQNEYITQLGSLVPLAYMAGSSYFSISMSRFLGSHSLLKGFSDSALLLEDAALVNKFLPALCYNYLLVTKMGHFALAGTALDSAVNLPTVLDGADGAFNLWYPMVGVLFSLFTLLGVWDRILDPLRRWRRSALGGLSGSGDDDDDDLDDEYQGGDSSGYEGYGYTALSVEEGRRMFQEEREAVGGGGRWGDGLLLRMRERLETEQKAKRKPQRGGFFSGGASDGDRAKAPEPTYRDRAAKKLLQKKGKATNLNLVRNTGAALGRLIPFSATGRQGAGAGAGGRVPGGDEEAPAAAAPRSGRARSGGVLGGGLPRSFLPSFGGSG